MLMDIRAIHDDRDYDWALRELESYFDSEPEPGTAAGDRFDVLAALVEVYEAKRFRIPHADPVDLLHFVIQNAGRTQDELGKLLGSPSKAMEILRRERSLTLTMIRSISQEWKLPLEVLAQPYRLARELNSQL